MHRVQRPIRMGLFNLFMNYGKARLARRVLGRVAGGNIFVMMFAGYVGKRVLNHFMANRQQKRLRAY
jgi:hypothetical protein